VAVRAEFTTAVEQVTDAAVLAMAPMIGTVAACTAAGRPRATHYRRHRLSPELERPAPVAHLDRPQPSALSTLERADILAVLHSERFCDAAPAQVWATLLDEGTYLGSQSTFYRLLHTVHGDVRERRSQASHPAKVKPELVAHGPNQVWSWDITKLHGPAKWSYFYLYAILDVFSRKTVGWMVATRESAALAEQLLAATIKAEKVPAKQLTIHADRGSSMASKPVALLLADLGVTKTHSRPRVSNDNPYSESQFKTLKYCPSFPGTFASLEEARAFCAEFFYAYNHHHRHAGLGLLTPEVVHSGQAKTVHSRRALVLDAAHALHSNRFRRPPQPPKLPGSAWINKPAESEAAAQ
jgi:putative transposase